MNLLVQPRLALNSQFSCHAPPSLGMVLCAGVAKAGKDPKAEEQQSQQRLSSLSLCC